MRQPVFDCDNFTSNRLCRLYLPSLTAATALAWVFSGVQQPVLAQAQAASLPKDENFQNWPLKLDASLPVPQSPAVRNPRSSATIPPPPPGMAGLNMGIPGSNLIASLPTIDLRDLENTIIEQQGGSSSQARRVTPQKSSLGSSRSSATSTRNNNSKLSRSLVRRNLNQQKNSSPSLISSEATSSTTEFVAPGAPLFTSSNNQPTFNQLLNSQTQSTVSPAFVAPLPPLPGETSTQVGVDVRQNLTFNQFLNQKSSTPAIANPTFNQRLNQQSPTPISRPPVQQTPISQPAIASQDNSVNIKPTFSQLFQSQGGSQPGVNDPVVPRNPSTVSQSRSNTSTPNSQVGNQQRPLIRSTALNQAQTTFQGVFLTQGDETSARARVSSILPLTPNALFGATLDLTSEDSSFDDSRREGLNINELYFATSLGGLPNLRFAVGQLDLTSYFDRNSFAKDGASHFFNPVFQTNPALAVAGISSRTGMLVNWSVTDNIDAKAAVFSSADSLSEFSLDGFAGEVGIRYGNLIVRGTYATDRDAGNRDSFAESFSIARGDNRFGPQEDDREEAYGLNAEVFIPNLKMGLFGRYGRFENRDLGRGADTYVFGASFLDLFTADDRLGIAYGRELSNDSLRTGEHPDVVELFYDFKFLSNLRLGFTIQGRDSFEEAVLGVRVKSDFDLTPRGSMNR